MQDKEAFPYDNSMPVCITTYGKHSTNIKSASSSKTKEPPMRRTWSVILFSIMLSGIVTAQEGKTLTMVGEGIVYANADRATVELSVKSFDTDPVDAVATNKKGVRRTLEALQLHKIDPKNISTSEIKVEPRHNPANAKVEYTATTTLRVNVVTFNTIGELLERSLDAGVNEMRLSSFYLSNQDSVASTAVAKAVTNAVAKATQFSEMFKLKLGKLIRIKVENSLIDPTVSAYDGPLNIYQVAQFSKSVLVFPPHVGVKGKVEAVFEISAKD